MRLTHFMYAASSAIWVALAFTCTAGIAASDLKDESVRANMRTVQLASEFYALEHDGLYPKEVDEIKLFMPGAEFTKSAPEGPANPFTAKKEWPSAGSIKDVTAARSADPPSIEPGKIEYSCIDNGKAYAIVGGGHDGKALPATSKGTKKGTDKTLVLSNL